MKIIDYALANTALLVSLDDVRPIRGFVFPELLSSLKDKYAFSASPNPSSPPRMQFPRQDGPGLMLAQGPWTFENGHIDTPNTTIWIPRLELAADLSVIVVHTSKTEEGDEILDDMATHLEGKLGFRDIMKTSRKRYGSNVVFEFDSGVEGGIQIIADLESIISPLLKTSSGLPLDAKWDRISFSFDPLDIPPSKSNLTMTFLIERRSGKPFSDNRWFSSAPMCTTDHIRTLGQIEEVLKRHKT
jgi:hypothetical protein